MWLRFHLRLRLRLLGERVQQWLRGAEAVPGAGHLDIERQCGADNVRRAGGDQFLRAIVHLVPEAAVVQPPAHAEMLRRSS